MTEIKTIKCHLCDTTWEAAAGPGGRGYMRADLVERGPEVAAHMRDVHGDEDAALRMERWVVTPPPWLNSTQK